ncbi:hypothetical protein G5S56_04875 [Shigella boydii]|uniref:Uncharacterized protein n=1 Tax=Shigella boydii TaxID=621 RepID=A0A7G6KBJ3_SHIBO|nr:hypothetical protein [Shigella boydii]EFZ0080736.1 hypothetical protein [Shigella flexneri]EFS3867744.1 hypothetical protein [Shigella boydii]EFZ0032035.1 hypothetical protein [Shigella boydii]QNC64586.1 hypothetical protein G5S56_04875 [Shigella boydii]HCS1417371.1 hypothetical protein [Shigella boydii]
MWLAENEGVKFWLNVLTELKKTRLVALPFHQASSLPTTASFLCAYRDTEHGCKFS